LAVFDATIDTRPLVLNQREIGTIETPFAIDRWTFNGSTNQQVRLDIVNSTSSAIKFSLYGPNGWVGFSGLSSDSELVTLPENGSYTLEVFTAGSGRGSYAFKLEEISQTLLPLGQSIDGLLIGSGSAQLFRVEMAQSNP
ncbi:MAG: hypothetical protein ACK53L_21165, partial [Pirellulaceae bacterium]